MNEPPITAEDLTLYALHSLDSAAAGRIDLLLRSSTAAREELLQIRGDLAMLALSAPSHTPPALSRQRLLKQVARERRTLPIPIVSEEEAQFAVDEPALTDPAATSGVWAKPALSAAERRSRVRLPRIVSEPELLSTPLEENFSSLSANDSANPVFSAEPAIPAADEGFAERAESLSHRKMPAPASALPPVPHERPAAEKLEGSESARAGRRAPGGVLWQMPNAPDSGEARETDDRYTPSAATVVAIDEPRRSRAAVVMAWTGWVAAAGLAASTVFAVRHNTALQQQIRTDQATLTATEAKTAKAELVLRTLESAASQRFVLARQDTAPVASARVAYLPEHGSLVFQGTNLDPLPATKTYELWLIPAGEGLQPIPAGTFKPDARGYATLVMPALPKGAVAGNFGVTIEDEGGSTTPTLPILLIGQQT